MCTSKNKKQSLCQTEGMGLIREGFAEEVRFGRISSKLAGPRAGCSRGGGCGCCQGFRAARAWVSHGTEE